MAGVGKTTLALRYADELAPDYPDGQLYVNLRGFDATAPPTEPLDALRDMLEGLGFPSQSLPESVDARSGLLRSILSDNRSWSCSTTPTTTGRSNPCSREPARAG